MFAKQSPRKLKVKVAGALVPTRSTEPAGRVGIGPDRVLVLGLSGVMISIKYIDMHICHESSVGVCFAKRSRIGNRHFVIFFPFLPRGGGSVAISFSSGLCRYV